MTEAEISQIASKVVSDTQFWIAFVGVVGAIVGSLLTIFGNIIVEFLKNKNERKIDKKRQEILKSMLEDAAFD